MKREREQRPDTPSGIYRRLVRNMAYLGGGTGAAALFNMFSLAFNVRALTPEEFGFLVLLQSSALALTGLMSFGTQQPVIQLGSPALAQDDKPRLGQIIGLGLSFDIAAASAASAIAFLVIFAGGSLLGMTDAQRSAAAVFAVALLFTGYLSSNGIFRLMNRFDLLGFIQAGTAAVTLLLSSLFYAIDASLIAYVWLWAASMAFAGQIQLWTSLYLIRKRGVHVSFHYRSMGRSAVRTFFAYSGTTWGTSSSEMLRIHGDSLLVGAMVSVQAVGLYNVAKQVAGILRKITTIYASVLFPEVSALAARDEMDRARKLRTRLVLLGCGATVAAVAATTLVGRPFLQIAFGAFFTAAYAPLIVLTATAGLQLIIQTMSIYVQVFVGPASLFLIFFASTLLFAILAPLLISAFSLLGAALAQVAFAVSLISIAAVVLRRSRLSKAPVPAAYPVE